MQLTAPLQKQFRQPSRYSGKLADCILEMKNRPARDWTIEQLDIRRYQHILEIGFGSGRRLQEAGRRLEIGFLAGIDSSVAMYQQAYRRNKGLIEEQLLQLHLGDINELSYPTQYFHTVYGNNAHLSWKDPVAEFMRLASLLKSNGKLVMVFQPRGIKKEEEVQDAADQIENQYKEAGLINVELAFNDMAPVTCISAIGYKG